jgi:hypothetical protein
MKNFLNYISSELCERSQLVIDLFAEDKILRESFLSRDFLSETMNKTRLKNILFKLAVQLSLKLIEPETASKF